MTAEGTDQVHQTTGARERSRRTPRRVRARSRWLPSKILLGQIGVGAAAIIGWELLSGPVLNPFFVPSPSQVLDYTVRYWQSGLLASDASATFAAAGLGFLLGAILGVAFGFILGETKTVSRVLSPYILAFYGIPRIALAPLFILWFGIGITSKVAVAASMVFFLVFFSTFSGVQQVPVSLISVARVLGASRWDLTRKVVFPACFPWVVTGIRISVPYAIIGAIVGEFIIATHGLGFRIALTANQFSTTGTFGGIIIIMIVVIAINQLLTVAERWVLRWQPEKHQEARGVAT